MTASHRWETTSSHVTSDGWVRYQRCACGLTRVLLGAEPVGVAARNDRRGSRLSMSSTDEPTVGGGAVLVECPVEARLPHKAVTPVDDAVGSSPVRPVAPARFLPLFGSDFWCDLIQGELRA